MTRVPTAEALSLTPWEGLAGLRGAADAWRSILASASIDPLCNDPDWVIAHAESYADATSLFGWTATDPEGTPIAVFAFKYEPSRGPLRARRALLAQDGSFESDYLDFPVIPGWERAAMRSLLLVLAAKPDVDAVVLHAMDSESKCLRELQLLLEDAGTPSNTEEVACAVAELPASFDDYLAARKKRMRSKIRQALRRADEAGATYRWCDEPEALAGELEGLFQLHQARWAAVGGKGSFEDEARREFYARFAPGHLAQGTLRLARLDLSGRAAAYQIGLVSGDRYYQLQEGYDPEHENLRVATALRAWAVEQLIGEGLEHYDFMAGASKHKSDWGGVDRPCTLLAFPVSPRGRLGFLARQVAKRLRD